ncbi:MAG: DUF721 domain-containing protein [Prevotellaceae bacterium]|nr:DUF721 domain-containing protein [Prevotella sp.]MDD7257438.1 DUF721 domain-containing protein [Prevotellaceae bacterium]MDY6129993.1 DUF721 domain-containing protein [Prevotella sp.]
MFRRKVLPLDEILGKCLRQNGLETPMLQMRILEAWSKISGTVVGGCTEEKYIKNQRLYVKISRPALRSDLSMIRSELVQRLNREVGATVIVDIVVY